MGQYEVCMCVKHILVECMYDDSLNVCVGGDILNLIEVLEKEKEPTKRR